MIFNNLYILFHCRIRPDTDRFTFCNGVVWERAQVLASFGNDWLNGIIDFSKSLHALGLDLTSFVCLCGLTLVTGMILAMRQLKNCMASFKLSDKLSSAEFFICVKLFVERHGLSNQKQVELLKIRITNLLKDHVTYTFGSSDGLNKNSGGAATQLSRINELRQALRSLNVQGLQRIFYLKLEDVVPAPPLIEKMFASSIPF